MKNYAKTLQSNGSSVMEKLIPLRLGKENNLQWNALQMMENAATEMRGRLQTHLPENCTENVQQVQMQHFEEMKNPEKVFLKAQFYGMSADELLLKIFVHQIAPKGKTAKLARAVYHLKIGR